MPIITERKFVCTLCHMIKYLEDDETIDTCPACGDGKRKSYVIKREEK